MLHGYTPALVYDDVHHVEVCLHIYLGTQSCSNQINLTTTLLFTYSLESMAEKATKALLEFVSSGDHEKPRVAKHITEHLGQLIERISSLEDEAAAKLNALSYEKIDCKGRDTQLLRNLKDVRQKAKEYAFKVTELIQYGSDEARQANIRQELRNRDLKPLKDYINQLQRHLSMCEESYQDVQEAINQLVSESPAMVGYCEKKVLEANSRRKTAIGMSVTAGVVGLAAIVGMFKFGVKLHLLSIAGIAFIVCGGTAFRASSYYAANLEEVEMARKIVQ